MRVTTIAVPGGQNDTAEVQILSHISETTRSRFYSALKATGMEVMPTEHDENLLVCTLPFGEIVEQDTLDNIHRLAREVDRRH